MTGAVSDASAKRIALSIANSPLVKTALAGEDANWGRVVMAVGKAGEPADRDRLSIWFGEHRVAFEGERDPAYSEASVSAYMKNSELAIRVDLGLGGGQATIWTCDLTARIHRHQRRLSKLRRAGMPPLLLVAACALIDADKRVLHRQRPTGKPMAGLWEFPGGKIEEGETPEDSDHPRA